MKLTKRLNHKVKTGILLVCSLGSFSDAHSQNLDLITCLDRAIELSPQKKQEAYIQSIRQLNEQITQGNYLPEIQLQGQASYQSDVFMLPFSLPGADAPSIPRDQYRFTLNLTQNLYDGGITKTSKQLVNAEQQLQSAQLEVSLHQVKQLITELYFGILTLRENQKINESLISELNNQLKRAQSAVTNGVLLPNELKNLQKEQLLAIQKKNTLQLREQSLLSALGDWLDLEVNQKSKLLIPQVGELHTNITRPEMAVFDFKIDHLEANKAKFSALNRPKVAAFASAGYGSPNPYNFFEVGWNPFYIVGGKLEWTPWDWSKSTNKKEVLSINQLILQSEKDHFEKSVQTELTQLESEVAVLEQSIQTDLKLLELQKDIMNATTARFEEGTLSATDYLSELNDLTQVDLHYQLDKLQLVQTKIQYQMIAGNTLQNE